MEEEGGFIPAFESLPFLRGKKDVKKIYTFFKPSLSRILNVMSDKFPPPLPLIPHPLHSL